MGRQTSPGVTKRLRYRMVLATTARIQLRSLRWVKPSTLRGHSRSINVFR